MENSPPIRLFINEDATPVTVHTSSKVCLHWQEAVKIGVNCDVCLSVWEKVPINDPVTWCSRMVVTPKPDGTPRRVIDYTSVNKHVP